MPKATSALPNLAHAFGTALLLGAAILSPAAACAQVGTLTPRVEYGALSVQVAPGAPERRLIAVVLWRGDSTARRAATTPERQQAYVEARYRAEGAGRSAFGSSWGGAATLAETDLEQTEVVVLGQAFPLPTGDSALVVMADRVDGVGGPPVLRGAVRVLATTLPASYWGQTWTSGDTTFMVRPRWERQQEMLLEVLRASPKVAEFLR